MESPSKREPALRLSSPYGPPGAIPPLAAQAAPPAPISGLATAALVLAIVGSMCFPVVAGVAAVLLGIAALVDIGRSQGAKGGAAVAWIAIAIASFTTLAYVAMFVAMFVSGARSASRHRTSSPPVYLPAPTTRPAPAPTGPRPRPAPTAAEVAMSKDTTTTETKVGTIVVVDIGSGARSLEAELRAQRTKAARASEKLVVQTTAVSCRPCLGLAASLADARMQRALAGVRLVRVDVNELGDELGALGVPHEAIPGLFLLGSDLRPADGITGGEWDDDTAANIAPVVGAFVGGKYTRRREAWKPGARSRPGGTSL
jgi:hypothetical protein